MMRLFVLVLCVAAAHAQTAAVEGDVKDAQGRPASAATVSLEDAATGAKITAQSDAGGKYRFRALAAGRYTLRTGGAAPATVALRDGETKTIDLALQDAFYDEPNFIVAGVTDAAGRGGHGSDTVMRSADALANATAALGGKTAVGNQAEILEELRGDQRAAERDPSEQNLFVWGADLLKHRAHQPAADVFAKGVRLYPRSARMLLGLGAASYGRGAYEQAARYLFAACDLDTADPDPYLFLGKVQAKEITELPGYVDRLARFAERHPGNAWANCYFAAGLWKQRKEPADGATAKRVRGLLERAIRIDPRMGAAYLQLGILYADLNEHARAMDAYRKAIEVQPEIEEPHYRLGLLYERTGEREKARHELDEYRRLSKKSAEDADRERARAGQLIIEPPGN